MTEERVVLDAPAAAGPRLPARLGPRLHAAALALILVVCGVAIVGAMRHTSTTFDEILLPSAGARGYATGRFDLVLDHPPLMQYVYGLPVYLTHPRIPAEPAGGWRYDFRYIYAQQFYWGVGNDPERLAFVARLVAAAIALLLVVAAYAFTRRRFGPAEGLLAAGLVAFLPDVLAHGGISYNDVPVALAFLLGVWALDGAARRPTLGRVVAAAIAVTLAVGVKYSAIALAPVALLLILAEGFSRGLDRRWLLRVAVGVPVALATSYLVLVLVFRGDVHLAQFRWGLNFNIRHARLGHGRIPAFLLGHRHVGGFWYFFPVAFLLKTPVALHVLLALALLGFARRLGAARAAGRVAVRKALASPLRAPLIGAAVYLFFLLRAHLEIGFRHGLPLLPLACIVIAAGVLRLWRSAGRELRAGIVLVSLWYAASSLSFYPDYIAFTSAYAPSRDRGDEVLIDSSLDWGQGLLELRDFMRAHQIPRVYLSYFGSAQPAGYGIDYLPLPSFFRLLPLPGHGPDPRWVAISATNLQGVYLPGDPFARFRRVQPDTVLGHTMFLYHIRD